MRTFSHLGCPGGLLLIRMDSERALWVVNHAGKSAVQQFTKHRLPFESPQAAKNVKDFR